VPMTGLICHKRSHLQFEPKDMGAVERCARCEGFESTLVGQSPLVGLG